MNRLDTSRFDRSRLMRHAFRQGTGGASGPVAPPGAPLLFYTMDDPASVTASGGVVTAWADQGGGTALTSPASAEPEYDADRGFARFNFNERMDFASPVTIDRRDFSVFVIAHLSDENNKGVLAGDSSGNFLFGMDNSDPSQMLFYDGGFKKAANVFPATGGRTTVSNGKMMFYGQGGAAASVIGNGFAEDTLAVLASGNANIDHLGAWLNGGFRMSGLVQAVLIYDSTPTISEVQSWAQTRYGVPLGTAEDTVIICDGDSLTRGFTGGAGEPAQIAYPAQLSMYNLGGARVHNVGADGWTVSDDTTAARTTAALSTFSDYTDRVVLFWAGTNDLFVDGDAAATIMDNIDDWIASVRAADAGAVIGGCTMIDRGSGTAGRATVNTYIKTTADFDFVVDLATDPRVSDAGDTAYFQSDGIHLTPAGYGVVAEIVNAALKARGVV